MNPFLIDPDTLKTLYSNGHITDEALTAIAPIRWLAIHYPALVTTPEQTEKAIAACQPKPKTCSGCVHFSSVHSCCMTRIDKQGVYLAVTSESPACPDFDKAQLPYFLKSGGTDHA